MSSQPEMFKMSSTSCDALTDTHNTPSKLDAAEENWFPKQVPEIRDFHLASDSNLPGGLTPTRSPAQEAKWLATQEEAWFPSALPSTRRSRKGVRREGTTFQFVLGFCFLAAGYAMMWPGLFHEALEFHIVGQPGEVQSIWSNVVFLWNQRQSVPGLVVPAIILFVFSVCMPFIKGGLLLTGVVCRLPKLLWFVARLSKYQFLDIYTLTLAFVFLNNPVITTDMHNGVYFFMGYCICSVIGTQLVCFCYDEGTKAKDVRGLWLPVAVLQMACVLFLYLGPPVMSLSINLYGEVRVLAVRSNLQQQIEMLAEKNFGMAALMFFTIILMPVVTYVVLPLLIRFGGARGQAFYRLMDFCHDWSMADVRGLAFILELYSFNSTPQVACEIVPAGAFAVLFYAALGGSMMFVFQYNAKELKKHSELDLLKHEPHTAGVKNGNLLKKATACLACPKTSARSVATESTRAEPLLDAPSLSTSRNSSQPVALPERNFSFTDDKQPRSFVGEGDIYLQGTKTPTHSSCVIPLNATPRHLKNFYEAEVVTPSTPEFGMSPSRAGHTKVSVSKPKNRSLVDKFRMRWWSYAKLSILLAATIGAPLLTMRLLDMSEKAHATSLAELNDLLNNGAILDGTIGTAKNTVNDALAKKIGVYGCCGTDCPAEMVPPPKNETCFGPSGPIYTYHNKTGYLTLPWGNDASGTTNLTYAEWKVTVGYVSNLNLVRLGTEGQTDRKANDTDVFKIELGKPPKQSQDGISGRDQEDREEATWASLEVNLAFSNGTEHIRTAATGELHALNAKVATFDATDMIEQLQSARVKFFAQCHEQRPFLRHLQLPADEIQFFPELRVRPKLDFPFFNAANIKVDLPNIDSVVRTLVSYEFNKFAESRIDIPGMPNVNYNLIELLNDVIESNLMPGDGLPVCGHVRRYLQGEVGGRVGKAVGRAFLASVAGREV